MMKRIELFGDVDISQQDQDTLAEVLNAAVKSPAINLLKEIAKKKGEILVHMHSMICTM